MTNSKIAQAARTAAETRLRQAHKDELAQYMHEEHESRGVTYTPRLSPQERAERDEAARKAKAQAKIVALAESAGLAVSVGEPTDAEAAVMANPEVSEAIRRTLDGTADAVELDRNAL